VWRRIEFERGPGDEGLCGGGGVEDQGVTLGECGEEGRDLFGEEGCGYCQCPLDPAGGEEICNDNGRQQAKHKVDTNQGKNISR